MSTRIPPGSSSSARRARELATTTTRRPEVKPSEGASPTTATSDSYAAGSGGADAASLLYATLQRVGVADLKTASANVLTALKSAPMTRTSPEIEAAGKSLVQSFLEDGVTAEGVGAAIAGLNLGEPEVTQALLQTLAARLESVSDRLDADAALGVVSQVLLPKISAPVAALQAARDLAPLGELSPYSVRASDGTVADLYSNEPGLGEMLAKLGAREGAVVGVGGAVLDAASRLGSDLVVAVDQDPRVAQGIEVVVGIFAAVDQELGVDAPKGERLKAVLARLDGSKPQRAVLEELRAQGVSASTLANLDGLLSSLAPGSANSVGRRVEDVWIRSDDAADRVDHLSALARQGRIVAFAGDLSAPETAAHVNRLLEAHGSEVGYFQLSNVLDWVPDTAQLVDNVAALKMADDAVIATTTMLADDGNELRAEIAQELGTHKAPRARPASEWFGDEGVGRKMHDFFWAAPRRRVHYNNVMSYFLRGRFDKTDAGSLDKLQAFVDAAMDTEVTDARFGALLQTVIDNSGLKPFVAALSQQSAGSFAASADDLKKTRRNLPAALDAYLTASLTEDAKLDFLRQQLGDPSVPEADLKRVAGAAQTVVELERGLAQLRRARGAAQG